MSKIFGGGGGSKSTTYTNADPWIGVQDPLKELYDRVGAFQPHQFFPGQTYAAADPLQMSGIQSNLNFAQGPGAQYGQSAMQAGQSLLNAPNVADNPYVQGMLGANQSAISEALARDMLPSIRRGAVASGQLGGSRQGIAEGIAVGDAAEALARANAQTMMGAYGEGLNASTRALGMAPQTQGLGLFPGQVEQQAGQFMRGEAQMPIDEAMARWNFAQQAPESLASLQSGIYSGASPYGGGQTTSTAPGASPIAGAVGGGLAGYGLGGAIGGSIPGPVAAGALGPWGALAGAVLGGLFS